MENTNKYSGTILEKTYSPIVFSSSDCLPSILSASIAAGVVRTFNEKNECETCFSTSIGLSALLVLILDSTSLIEIILKSKELKEITDSYNSIIEHVDKDFENYCEVHETYLKEAMNSTDNINKWKAVMKEYLLKELSEQLKRCGLKGEFKEPTIERLDPRDWPINEGYKRNEENNSNFSNQWIKYQDIFFDVFGGPLLLPIKNRIKIKQIRNIIEEIKPIAEFNEKQMKADLNKLELFSVALDNIDKIYETILNKLKPIMKVILRALEDKYQGNVNLMPPQQADALYNIKTLLKDLCEIRIIPKAKKTDSVVDEVCTFSNCISEKYENIRNDIYQNFI